MPRSGPRTAEISADVSKTGLGANRSAGNETFAGLAVTAGLIVAIPVANAQTWVPNDAGKSPHHAASHSNRPHFGTPLQTMLRHLLRPLSSRTVGEANPPRPQTLPTKDMPAVLGLE